MSSYSNPIGKIVKIDGITLSIEISPDKQLQNVSFGWYQKDYLISIHKYVYCYLPCKRKIISRIKTIYDRDLFTPNGIFDKKVSKYIVEANLTAIYDDFSGKIDTGINTFPIIGAEIFALPTEIYNKMLNSSSKYKLTIGESFQNNESKIESNPDILLGKHLAIFGNTGTGKSCTVTSIIQGLKRRLKLDHKTLKSKIIIFDANNEYESAFNTEEFSVCKINKEKLRIPYSILSNSEYIRLFDASQGVQSPTLIEALNNNPKDFTDIPDKIMDVINTKKTNDFSFNQWFGWNSTMINRIQRLIENDDLMNVINTNENSLSAALTGDSEIIIIDLDFDRYEMDIITFLVCKYLYNEMIDRTKPKNKSLLLVLEEAHRYINERDTEEYKLGNFYIERIAREGRKYGLSMIISSQRPSELSKSVISQCNSFIIHRITNKFDYEYISKTIGSSNNELLKALPGLERQYAVVNGEAFTFSDIVKISNASPIPDSNDPKVIDNWLE